MDSTGKCSFVPGNSATMLILHPGFGMKEERTREKKTHLTSVNLHRFYQRGSRPAVQPALPVVSQHQSAVMLNMSFISVLIASLPQLRAHFRFCSAAAWRGFKDLGLLLRNMLTVLSKSDGLCKKCSGTAQPRLLLQQLFNILFPVL